MDWRFFGKFPIFKSKCQFYLKLKSFYYFLFQDIKSKLCDKICQCYFDRDRLVSIFLNLIKQEPL